MARSRSRTRMPIWSTRSMVISLMDFSAVPRKSRVSREKEKGSGFAPVYAAGAREEGVKANDMFDMTGQAGIVTGGASGLGLAMTEVIAEHGCAVTILDRDRGAMAREVARPRRNTAVSMSVSPMRA